MKYIVTTKKSVEQASADLQAAVVAHKFGVLGVHDIKGTLNSKGVEFDNECQVLEICNPFKAKAVLEEDMELNMALPCRVSVYSQAGQTRIGMINPTQMLEALSDSPVLKQIATEVEQEMVKMIDEAR